MKNLMRIALLLVPIFLLFCSEKQEETTSSGLNEEEVTYNADGTDLRGYLVYDQSVKGKRPGILVVHEWWGYNEYARRRARMLAKLGYTALALDMYGEGKQAQHPKEAQEFSSYVMSHLDTAQARFMAAMDLLRLDDSTDPEKIGAIGYCFGGGVVLQMALRGVDLDGVVSFHGTLPQNLNIKPDEVEAKILVCHGGDDKFSTPEQIKSFKQALDSAGVDYEFKVYPGAMHSFTNPAADSMGKKFNLPLAYNKAADQQSWEDMKAFFNRVFAGGESSQ